MSHSFSIFTFGFFVRLVLILCGSLRLSAMVNPSLQPFLMVERYQAVLELEVKSFNLDTEKYTMQVSKVLAGEFEPETLEIFAPEDDESELDPLIMRDGDKVVAFARRVGRRGGDEVLMYVGLRQWHEVKMEAEDFSQWNWVKPAPESMSGTFNGDTGRLVEMIGEIVDGSYFYPSVSFSKFNEDTVVASFDGPLGAVALYDLIGEGRLDILVSTPQGIRLYEQKASMAFTNVTAEQGLADLQANSLAVGDVNGDGRADLLLDASLYLGSDSGFIQSDVLPEDLGEVKVASFADLNADGHPDVLISLVGGGLRAFINPGEAGAAFTEVSEAMGLREADVQPEGNAYFALGDWSGNGKPDLFYGTGRAQLLLQTEDGRFSRYTGRLNLDLRDSMTFEEGLTGAAVMAPMWRENRMDVISPSDTRMFVITNMDGKAVDVTGQGNEIGVVNAKPTATLAEDLTMNGHVDLYTITREESSASNTFHLNRGYGSFMYPDRYETMFGGSAHSKGAGGIAAGDVNGDGANDLLLAGLDGRLVLMMNDTLSLRTPLEHPTHHEGILQNTAILTVSPFGNKGVVGAKIELKNEAGEVVALRQAGSGAPAGNQNPLAKNIAVRKPGTYKVVVTFTDGHQVEQSVTLEPAGHTDVKLGR